MIVGKKVVLRPLRERDLTVLYDLAADIRSMGDYWPLHVPSEAQWTKRFAETGMWEENHGFLLICDPDESILGQIVFFKPAVYMNTFEIGYRIFKEEDRGKGFASEAVSLVSAYLFETKTIDRIQATTMSGNDASERVLEKCGFKFEGIMRKAVYHRGVSIDLKLFALLREDGKSLKSQLG